MPPPDVVSVRGMLRIRGGDQPSGPPIPCYVHAALDDAPEPVSIRLELNPRTTWALELSRDAGAYLAGTLAALVGVQLAWPPRVAAALDPFTLLDLRELVKDALTRAELAGEHDDAARACRLLGALAQVRA